MKRITSFVLIGLLGIGILAGCASAEPKGTAENSPPASQEQMQGEGLLAAEGIYVGQMDANSIEITVKGEPKAFRIEEIKDQFPKLQENDPVQVKYIENEHGQLMIKEIWKK